MAEERSIFEEISDVQRLISDTRETLYSLQSSQLGIDGTLSQLIHDKEIMISGLELYLGMLESTVSARDRIHRREKKSPYNGRDAKH